MLEARERSGGRIFTHRDRETPVPIELGAEFIHGRADALSELLDDARLTSMDVAGQRYAAAGPERRPLNDFSEQLDRVMRRLPQPPAQDRIPGTRPAGRRLARERRLARASRSSAR